MEKYENIAFFADDVDGQVITQMMTAIKAVDGSIGALMADGHLGYRMPIGAVIGYPNYLSPSGVGYDIGCGNLAIKIEHSERLKFTDVVIQNIVSSISFGIGGTNKVKPKRRDVDFIEKMDWTNPLMKGLKDLAINQFGTVGGGNHYVDLMHDKNDNKWIACHFGSRGFGWKICDNTIKALGEKDSQMGAPILLKKGTAIFEDYEYAMNCATHFAEYSRYFAMDTIMNLFGWSSGYTVSNHHNYAEQDYINNKEYWVHRKGATRVSLYGTAFIGGSMGDVSAIVRANDETEREQALYSAPHGAGRVMSRGQAKKMITQDMMDAQLSLAKVKLIGGGVDESPAVYRPLLDVLKKHPYIKVEALLYPDVVIMASGRDEYKD